MPAIPLEQAHVGTAQDLLASLEVQAVRRERDPAELGCAASGRAAAGPAGVLATVVVQPNLPLLVIDVDVRRGDVAAEVGRRERQDTRLVGLPGAAQVVGVSEADVAAIVVGEVEVVLAKVQARPAPASGRCFVIKGDGEAEQQGVLLGAVDVGSSAWLLRQHVPHAPPGSGALVD